jgi:hypothetical protein
MNCLIFHMSLYFCHMQKLKGIFVYQFGCRCYVQNSMLNEVLDIPYVIILILSV